MSDATYSSSLDRVVERWQDGAFTADLSQIHWMASPVVCRYLNRRASGEPNCDWLTWLMARYLRERAHRVLVLGCGDGWLERSIASNPWIERIDAFDVASGAVDRASAEASRLGLSSIHYGVRDLNREPVPDGPYELIIAHSVIHHIENLEFFFEGLRNALADDGVLLVNEYVGPKRFQFSDLQMEIMNGLFSALPHRYHVGRLGGNVYAQKLRPTVEEMIATDPSEAVRSDEIPAFLQRSFEVLESIDYGGTILHHLLYDIVPNFDAENAGDLAMLETLCLVEEALMVKGGLPADFQLFAAAKTRIEPATPMRPEPFGSDEIVERDVLEPLAGVARWLTRRRAVTGPVVATSRPAREEQSLELTGDRAADWVQWILVSAGRNDLSVRITGGDGHDLARRLEADPAVRRVTVGGAVHASETYDVVLGFDGPWSRAELASLLDAVSDGGTIALVSRVSAPRPSQWLVQLADRMATVMPQRWRRKTGLRARLRRALALAPRDGAAANDVVGILSMRSEKVAAHPLSSQLMELLLSSCTLPTEPADESEDALIRLLVASDAQLVRNSVIGPTTMLFVARDCNRNRPD